MDDLCLNIFENYTALELEIAKRDPGFAVVSNVGYAPFHSQLMYLLQKRGVDVSVSPVEHWWRLPGYSTPNFLQCSTEKRPVLFGLPLCLRGLKEQ